MGAVEVHSFQKRLRHAVGGGGTYGARAADDHRFDSVDSFVVVFQAYNSPQPMSQQWLVDDDHITPYHPYRAVVLALDFHELRYCGERRSDRPDYRSCIGKGRKCTTSAVDLINRSMIQMPLEK